jgi:hypothetical protein
MNTRPDGHLACASQLKFTHQTDVGAGAADHDQDPSVHTIGFSVQKSV